MTTRVGLRELARDTSELVHRAAAGETVMIIEHGRPVAMLVPLPVAGDLVANQLVREGKLTPAGDPAGVAALLAITPHPAANGIDSADVVSELREDRL